MPPDSVIDRDVDANAYVLAVGGRRFAAFTLAHVLGLSVLEVREAEHLEGLARRHAEFVTCLVNECDQRFVYDLRYLATPARDAASYGTVRLALVVRGEGVGCEDMTRHADGIANLLEAQFGEYAFARVHAGDIASILAPFAIGFLASFARRWSYEPLDTLVRDAARRTPGFDVVAAPRTEASDTRDRVLHFYPFVPVHRPLRALLQALVSLDYPVAISIRLSPTRLDCAEERFLEEQIATCERYAQVSIGVAPEDVSGLRPTLRRRAAALQDFASRLLLGLRDNAALMTIEAAAPAQIPRPVLELVGAALTFPAGGSDHRSGDDVKAYLVGGYDLIDRSAGRACIEAFQRAEVRIEATSGDPSEVPRLRHVFDSLEAAAAFRFPPSATDELPGLELRMWRSLAPPRGLPQVGVLVGHAGRGSRSTAVRLSPEDAKRHTYVVGQSGTGKTTALRTMILADMAAGGGMCVIDPHGDLFFDVLRRVPPHRRDDVVVIDPADSEWPIGLNPLEPGQPDENHKYADEFCGIMRRMLEDEFGDGAAGRFAGPVFFQHLRMNLLLLLSDRDRPGTLLDLYTIFNQPQYYKKWLPLRSADPVLRGWVENVLPKVNYLSGGSDGVSFGSYIGSKLETFVFDPRLRNMFAQVRSTVNLRAAMDEGRIVLVNLAKGLLTEQVSRFFGMILVSRLIAAIFSRIDVAAECRRPFTLYVDEFQSVATEGFVLLLSEARKFAVQLVLANQFVSQIRNRRIMDAVFGNSGTLISFRVGHADAELLEPYLAPEVNRRDLVRLPNWRAYMSTMVGGTKLPVFDLQTVASLEPGDAEVASAVVAKSRARYATAKATVESTWARAEG